MDVAARSELLDLPKPRMVVPVAEAATLPRKKRRAADAYLTFSDTEAECVRLPLVPLIVNE